MMQIAEEPLVLLYSATNVTTATNTGVKLFDPAISWTILLTADANMYHSVQYNRGLVGLSSYTTKFGVACGITDGNDNMNDAVYATANRYTAAFLNPNTTNLNCFSLGARENNDSRRVTIAVKYNVNSGLFQGVSKETEPSGRKYYHTTPPVTSDTVRLFIGGQTGIIRDIKIYQGAMSLVDMRAYIS